MDKKFSIIVPIYNTEKYLPECVESVICQTYKNLEIILVNDGSLGNADEICKKYLALDTRIKYFSKKNEGVAIARNFGIAKASGDYIFCLDSDDTLDKFFVEELYKSFKKSGSELLVVGSQFNDDIKMIGGLPTWGFAVSKAILDKYPDIRFQEGFQPCEDGLFSHKLLAVVNNVSKCNSAKYIYRSNPNSSEHNINIKKILNDIPQWLNILENFYDKYNLWQTHKLHLLLFVEIEPFGRLNTLKLNLFQKIYLAKLLLNFICKHNLLSSVDISCFTPKFQIFIKSKSYLNYISNYAKSKISIRKFSQKIFSVVNEYSGNFPHKVVTIFGLKMKFKKARV